MHASEVSILELLDLRTAFDTIDYDILITTVGLGSWLAYQGLLIIGFRLIYLTENIQCLLVKRYPQLLLFHVEVPQGSILGHILFSLHIFTLPLVNLIQHFNIFSFLC